jgi:hypothetical protein
MAGIGRRMTRPKPRLRRICSRRLTTYFSAISFRWQTNRFFRLARGGRRSVERIGHERPAEPRSVGAVTRRPVPFTLNR